MRDDEIDMEKFILENSKQPPSPPKSVGFACVELLDNDMVQCTVSWDTDKMQDEEIRKYFFMVLARLSQGDLAHHFAEFALEYGAQKGQAGVGEVIADIFEASCPHHAAMRPSDVFSTENPRRAPFASNE